MYQLTFAKPVAAASFRRLPREAQLQFNDSFKGLLLHPTAASADLDVHRLQGYQNVWTLRIPPWRAIYAIDGQEVVLIVFGHRRNVYALLHALLPPEGRYVTRHSSRRSQR